MPLDPGDAPGHPSPRIRVALLDGDAVMLEALARLLELAEMVVTTSSGQSDRFVAQLEADTPDVALLGLALGGSAGTLALLEELGHCLPAVRCLVFSGSAEPADLEVARRAGAAGFLTRSRTTPDALVASLRGLAAGSPAFPAVAAPPRSAESLALARLTPRQRQVLQLVAQGFDNLKIAALLDITEATAKAHMAALYRKLEADNRVELMILARCLE